MIAGTNESPDEYFYRDGVRLKKYRGMGSKEAILQRSGNAVRYYNKFNKNKPVVAQGVSGTVLDKGSIHKYIPYLLEGLKHSLQNIGISNISDLHKYTFNDILRFEMRTHSSQIEGNVHSLITFEHTE